MIAPPVSFSFSVVRNTGVLPLARGHPLKTLLSVGGWFLSLACVAWALASHEQMEHWKAEAKRSDDIQELSKKATWWEMQTAIEKNKLIVALERIRQLEDKGNGDEWRVMPPAE
jgi:hypothetical protein